MSGNVLSIHPTAPFLPVVEAIDPALVPELFWRSLALRYSAYEPRVAVSAERLRLPLLLARYDRQVAATLLEPWAAAACADPGGPVALNSLVLEILAVVDPRRAVALVESMPAPADNLAPDDSNWARIRLADTLGNQGDSQLAKSLKRSLIADLVFD
jgi:hypothetical protein